MFTLQASLAFCFVLSLAHGAPNSSESETLMKWEAPEYLKKEYPYYLSGHDHDGSPVFAVEFGKWDFRSAVEAGPEATAELDKWITQMILRWRSAGNEAEGSPGAVAILDYEGLDIVQFGNIGGTPVELVIQLFLKQFPKFRQLVQLPGIQKIYIINANYLFERVFELGKPMLGEVANMFELYGTNPAKWKPVLLKAIPAEELPAWYGGSNSHQVVRVFG